MRLGLKLGGRKRTGLRRNPSCARASGRPMRLSCAALRGCGCQRECARGRGRVVASVGGAGRRAEMPAAGVGAGGVRACGRRDSEDRASTAREIERFRAIRIGRGRRFESGINSVRVWHRAFQVHASRRPLRVRPAVPDSDGRDSFQPAHSPSPGGPRGPARKVPRRANARAPAAGAFSPQRSGARAAAARAPRELAARARATDLHHSGPASPGPRRWRRPAPPGEASPRRPRLGRPAWPALSRCSLAAPSHSFLICAAMSLRGPESGPPSTTRTARFGPSHSDGHSRSLRVGPSESGAARKAQASHAPARSPGHRRPARGFRVCRGAEAPADGSYGKNRSMSGRIYALGISENNPPQHAKGPFSRSRMLVHIEFCMSCYVCVCVCVYGNRRGWIAWYGKGFVSG